MTNTILPLTELGNPILRKKAKPIATIINPDIQDLISNMLATLKHANGVGLAAPQVGVSLRLYIVSPNPNDDPYIVINPTLKRLPSNQVQDWEGCLSIPGIRGLVNRSDRINVEFHDQYGVHHSKEFSGFISRVFQHEHDHIDGIVYLDRIQDTKHIVTESEYIKRMESDT